MNYCLLIQALAGTLILGASTHAAAQDSPGPADRKIRYSPYPAKDLERSDFAEQGYARCALPTVPTRTAPYLTAYWQDPTVDARIFGVKLPTDVPASIQERDYTSPIGYTPGG